MRYVIYGAGAIGASVGAKLHMNGIDVALIARGAHLKALQTDGLTLIHPDASEQLKMPAYGHPSEIEWRPDDVCVLAVKSQDTQAALEQLRLCAGDDVPVVCAQNGVENERMALRLFPRVYGQLVFMIALHLEPGVVDLAGWPKSGVFDLGRFPSGVDALSEQMASDFDSSGLIARAEPRIMAWKYTKMLYILQNPVQAVCGPQADYADIVKQIRDEAMACFAAAGIDWVPMEDFAARQKLASPPAGSRPGGGSTWQSLARGAGSIEVDFLNGEITLLGRLHEVPTPANETLQVLADRMAREHQQPGSITPDEVRAEIAKRS
jgi:2-dehydropantoate 2-reductase